MERQLNFLGAVGADPEYHLTVAGLVEGKTYLLSGGTTRSEMHPWARISHPLALRLRSRSSWPKGFPSFQPKPSVLTESAGDPIVSDDKSLERHPHVAEIPLGRTSLARWRT